MTALAFFAGKLLSPTTLLFGCLPSFFARSWAHVGAIVAAVVALDTLFANTMPGVYYPFQADRFVLGVLAVTLATSVVFMTSRARRRGQLHHKASFEMAVTSNEKTDETIPIPRDHMSKLTDRLGVVSDPLIHQAMKRHASELLTAQRPLSKDKTFENQMMLRVEEVCFRFLGEKDGKSAAQFFNSFNTCLENEGRIDLSIVTDEYIKLGLSLEEAAISLLDATVGRLRSYTKNSVDDLMLTISLLERVIDGATCEAMQAGRLNIFPRNGRFARAADQMGVGEFLLDAKAR